MQGVTSFETNEREEKSEPKGGWKFCGICGAILQDLIRWTQECWRKNTLTLTKIIFSVVTGNKGIAGNFEDASKHHPTGLHGGRTEELLLLQICEGTCAVIVCVK